MRQPRPSQRTPSLRLLAGLAALCASSAGPAAATESLTLAALGGAEGVRALSDGEMQQLRGGFGSVLFGIAFYGDVARLAPTMDAAIPPNLDVSLAADNQVQIIGAFGGLPGNFNGVLQTTNIIGDMNVVNNNLVINVAILPPGTTSLSTLLPPPSALN